MSRMKRPESLPASFGPLWDRIAREDAALGSRRMLAAKLRISTHTLQRILVDGSVPDLRSVHSTYIVSSWVRTLTRMASGLGMDPVALIESTGLEPDDRVRSLVEAEQKKLKGAPSECDAPGDRSLDLAGFLADLIGTGGQGGDDTLRDARRQMHEALDRFLVASGRRPPGMAGAGDLTDGKFCRSCMASLSDPHNKGVSVQFCRWCSDEEGRLKPQGEVHTILANWFMHWQAGITPPQASERARHYMLAMPAWAAPGADGCEEPS